MHINITLKELINKINMSQRTLATESGVRLATINAMCKNEIKHVPLDNLASICETLNCEITDILELKKEQTD